MFILLASIINTTIQKQTNKQTKNNAPTKRKDLKERTKGWTRFCGSLKTQTVLTKERLD
jgi:hypothetical protein